MASADWTIGSATLADEPGIMRLIEECFSPRWRSIVIYGAPGAGRYTADLIRRQHAGGDGAFVVAHGPGGRVLAFVELRRLAGSMHLNNMATSVDARGRGLYAALMAEALRLGRAEGYTEASLDVFVDNPIRTFLLKIGYRVQRAHGWRAAALPDGPTPVGVYISGLPQADAVHRRFGFSRLEVFTRRGARYDVGRLDGQWFRVTDPAIVAERDVLVALHRLDPARDLLAIVPVTMGPSSELALRQVAVSERLMAEIDTVLPQLEGYAERAARRAP